MSYFWVAGVPDGVQPKYSLRNAEKTNALKNGDIIEAWGYVGEWDEQCPRTEELAAWRLEGDPLCDAALLEIFPRGSSSVGKDLLESLYEGARSEPSGSAQAFLDAMMESPPEDICASDEDIALGAEFFYEHSVQIMQALMFFSLAGGFGSPGITKTLYKVSYLVPRNPSAEITQASNDRTFARLLETFQYVLDVMGCEPPASRASEKSSPVLAPGGSGWASTVRVRMLHGVARRRIRDRDAKDGVEEEDVPINQEDLAATLASFAIAPLWCIRRVHLPVNPREAMAYIDVWRHVGFYMGIAPHILRKYFRDQISGEKFLAIAALHLFSPPPPMPSPSDLPLGSDLPPPPVFAPPTVAILSAISNRPPFPASFAQNCALARFYLSDSLADHLDIPPTRLSRALRLRALLVVQTAPVFFGPAWAWVRPGWRRKRVRVMREGMERSVRWLLGMRRTSFRPRTGRDSSQPRANDSKHALPKAEGEIGDGVLEAERLVPDPDGAKRLTREYKEVFAEMIAVTGVVLLVGAISTYRALTWMFGQW